MEPKVVEPAKQQAVPPLSVETPFEALLLAMDSINRELKEAREALHGTRSQLRMEFYQDEIKRLEQDRMEILRILGEQAKIEREASQETNNDSQP